MKVTNVVPAGVKSLTIELNAAELQFLVAVLNSIGGDPVKSRRRYSDDLLSILRDAGVDCSPHGFNGRYDHNGSITFQDND